MNSITWYLKCRQDRLTAWLTARLENTDDWPIRRSVVSRHAFDVIFFYAYKKTSFSLEEAVFVLICAFTFRYVEF
jgi:hypothetical protein